MSGGVGIVVALSGGIGGAKLALGLSHVVEAKDLIVVANTADDFSHLGLAISPDIDTLTYVLAGLDDPVRGWGRRDETWNFMAALEGLGGETWFSLGDHDLALHVERTRRLAAGENLSEITSDLSRRLGVSAHIIPMSDDPVRTRIRTAEGWLDFQDYFVRLNCEPQVREIAFDGAAAASPTPGILERLADPRLRAIVVCPSNPLISIDPILAVPGLREGIRAAAAPVIAVSPIVAGQAIKGPTVKMFAELGVNADAATVRARYADFVDTFILDESDAALADALGPGTLVAPTIMRTLEDRIALARTVLDAASRAGPKEADDG